MKHSIPTDEQLDDRFAPIYEQIAAGAIEREQNRVLAHEAVQWLKSSGFTALRVPREHGGGGITLPQFFRQLSKLGAADSNLPQILRAHFGFIESRLEDSADTQRARWFARIAQGETLGAATSERGPLTHNSVTLRRDVASGALRLDGEKYYSTGALYADWLSVTAHDDESDLTLVIPSDSPGVTRVDDWDGFGQRLTASGTTRFDSVAVTADAIVTRYDAAAPRRNSIMTAFYQTVHLATLAGIVRAVIEDSVTFVQGRTRTYGVAGQSSPRNNALVQRVVGRLASLGYSTRSIVDTLAQSLERLHARRRQGAATQEDYIALDIEAYEAQQIVIEQALEATTLMFEVGGASATSETHRFDRHWRNARTIASHNPLSQREAAVGDFYLNGVAPEERFSLPHGKIGAEA
ncbi:Acyl-CoA dehydrogenase type 2 domain [Burkholderia sp. H160]|nr:Acyl-CoA dehydrogenase type 2 domain [Burkholderia sp. H160]